MPTPLEPAVESRFRQAFLLILLGGITVAFIAVVRAFLLTILLAAVFAGLSHPVFRRLTRRFGGHAVPAALTTLLLLLVLVLAPLIGVLTAATNEALRLSDTVTPRIQQLIKDPASLDAQLRGLPFYRVLEPYRDQILTRAGELLGSTSAMVLSVISATTVATASLVFYFFVLLYTMFYFLTDGPDILRAVLVYLPFDDSDKDRVLDRFLSVTRATLKGTVFIGAAQGLLGGLSFWVAGIDGAVFWGTVMTVLSIIPGVGGAVVWVPAVVILAIGGDWGRALGLTAFNALIVGSVDNLLRPRLVGRDAQLHELMIFFSTLGGLMMFGPMGFLVGPVLAGLFVTAWEMFGTTFRRELRQPNAIVGPDDRTVA